MKRPLIALIIFGSTALSSGCPDSTQSAEVNDKSSSPGRAACGSDCWIDVDETALARSTLEQVAGPGVPIPPEYLSQQIALQRRFKDIGVRQGKLQHELKLLGLQAEKVLSEMADVRERLQARSPNP
jgi:hypothetical protein